MTVTVKVLVESKEAEDAQTTQYTATDVTAIIDKCTVTNTTGSPDTFAVNLVPQGDTAGDDNLILSKTIAAGQCYTCPEIVGQNLAAGDFISTIAGTANTLTIRISGREVT